MGRYYAPKTEPRDVYSSDEQFSRKVEDHAG
jgi:hypothetical protein